MSETVRAKFRCASVESFGDGPIESKGYNQATEKSTTIVTWPRKFRFQAVYDMNIPEDKRYARHTPYGELMIQVDNPNVSFKPGTSYYLDFSEVEKES